MRYLSIDLESTGLLYTDYIIEFACIPLDTETETLESDLKFHTYISCPSYEELLPQLSSWAKENNQTLIKKAHNEGIQSEKFRNIFEEYLCSEKIKKYFSKQRTQKITLLGKSLNALDLPLLQRDLSYDFLRQYFHHQVQDISSLAQYLVDAKKIPENCHRGSELAKFLGVPQVPHTALEDAIMTANFYFKLLHSQQVTQ